MPGTWAAPYLPRTVPVPRPPGPPPHAMWPRTMHFCWVAPGPGAV